MTPERRRQIRAYAVRRAARELDSTVSQWGGEVQEELYPDEDEREEFQRAINLIIARLERRGGPSEPSDPSR